MTDPTYVHVETDNRRDPLVKRMRGRAIHGNTPFDVPFISQIEPGFYQGGCENGLILPSNIKHVISLYKWERYLAPHGLDTFHEVTMYDSNDGPDHDNIVELATLVNDCRTKGDTLVHCQAGLNRSGLVAGAALVLEGWSGVEAIDILRQNRSQAVLCNQTFARWLREFKP